MAILDDLIASLPEDVPVRTVMVSTYWTAVCSRHCGMSATLRSNRWQESLPTRDVDLLLQKSAHELAQLAYSTDLLQASLGVATINSLQEVDESRAVEMKASEVLFHSGQGKDIAFVGHFRFIPQIRKFARRLWVIEQEPDEGEFPAGSAADLLPRADVVVITATTLVNHTLDNLLTFCHPAATVMIVGPSTPFSPVLFDHGVTMICGTYVVNETSMLRTVRQAASLRQVQGVKLLTLAREGSM